MRYGILRPPLMGPQYFKYQFDMYRKELPIGDRVTEVLSSADDQLSEYDSDSSDDEDSATHGNEIETVPILPFKDSPQAYRTTHAVVISCSFIILRYKKLYFLFKAVT